MTAGEDLGELLAACARGDREALHRIYRSSAAHLFGVALRIVRRREVAEDVVHEAFLQIWQNAARFDGDRGSAKAWMLGIVRYRAIDALRGAEKVADDPDALEALADESFERGSHGLAGDVSAAELKHCLEQLAVEPRRSILLAYVEGYSREEIAQRLAAPVGTVKSWIHRGLIALKGCLEP